MSGHQTVELRGEPIEVFTYRPSGCALSAVLLVFHGVDRNPAGYRDDAVPLAQRTCMTIVAPLFDEARFPGWSYQRGGVVHNGTLQPPERWTIAYAPALADWVRKQEGRPELPSVEIGHSAGAQFLSRVVAYAPDASRQVIIANPSTWVRASLDITTPYGFAGLGSPQQDQEALRRYLAAPVTVLLGREDRGSKNLATSDEAEDQGANRFERGQNVFAEAQAAARQHGWAFNWRLAVIPGVGHNARQMLTSDAAFAATRP